MSIEAIFDRTAEERPMNIVGFFSGGASSLVAVIEKQKEYEKVVKSNEQKFRPFHVVAAFTDNPSASGIEKVAKFGIPVLVNDIEAYHAETGVPGIRDKELRKKMDKKQVREMRTRFDSDNISMIGGILDSLDLDYQPVDYGLLSGYMWYLTPNMIDEFRTIQNVHPADLTIKNEKGKRKFVGDNAVYDAIKAGQTYTKSSIHIVTQGVDEGPIVVQSKELMVPARIDETLSKVLGIGEYSNIKEVCNISQKALIEAQVWFKKFCNEHQSTMKTECDIPAFVKAVELTAEGKIALHEGKVYIKENDGWKHAPGGYQL